MINWLAVSCTVAVTSALPVLQKWLHGVFRGDCADLTNPPRRPHDGADVCLVSIARPRGRLWIAAIGCLWKLTVDNYFEESRKFLLSTLTYVSDLQLCHLVSRSERQRVHSVRTPYAACRHKLSTGGSWRRAAVACRMFSDGAAVTTNGDGLPQQRKAVDPTRTTIWRPYVHVSVRECISTREAGCPCVVPRFHAFAQVGTVSKILSSQDALVVLGILAILVMVLVILPAVWSEKPTRRKAALADSTGCCAGVGDDLLGVGGGSHVRGTTTNPPGLACLSRQQTARERTKALR